MSQLLWGKCQFGQRGSPGTQRGKWKTVTEAKEGSAPRYAKGGARDGLQSILGVKGKGLGSFGNPPIFGSWLESASMRAREAQGSQRGQTGTVLGTAHGDGLRDSPHSRDYKQTLDVEKEWAQRATDRGSLPRRGWEGEEEFSFGMIQSPEVTNSQESGVGRFEEDGCNDPLCGSVHYIPGPTSVIC